MDDSHGGKAKDDGKVYKQNEPPDEEDDETALSPVVVDFRYLTYSSYGQILTKSYEW